MEDHVATVVAALSMSLDGYIAGPSGDVGPLFEWYQNGDVETIWPGMNMRSHTTAASAEHLRRSIESAGALVVGRRVFDYTNGWGGDHPLGVPVFVVTHSTPEGWPRADVPFTFVTEGVEDAVAQAKEIAGERNVGVNGPNIAQQCLNLGLLDEVHVDLVPVLLGEGIRFFENLKNTPVMLEDPVIVQGLRVTHITFHVRKRHDLSPR
jgi:dihydrofolate reductase